MNAEKHKSHGLVIPIVMIFFVVLLSIALIFLGFNATTSSQTLTYTEENSQTNTALYVILNNNEMSPSTTLPFKDILSTAIAEGRTNIDTTMSIDYNGVKEDVNLKNILVNNLQKIGVKEYDFFVLHDTKEIMTLKTPSFSTNSSEEIEYISVPSDNPDKRTATVVLKISKYRNDKELANCPEDMNFKCYPRLTCTSYNGNCKDDKYSCGVLECCCEMAEI